jgi:NAD(P)-dependent dehydrogenase (short-subunit alcohol dehydrogenase family)
VAKKSSHLSAARTIVLTGVSRGLGLAMAEGFISAGHTVVGCARSVHAIEGLRQRWPEPHRFDVVNVGSDEAVASWAASVLAVFGPPELLVNNAAVINRNAKLWEVPAGEFSEVIDVNVKGVVNVIRHFVPAMASRHRGVVVNFSSTWGRVTSPEVAPYCATKFAIEGLTQALAQELPEGMAAVAFNPGVINTDMLRSCFGTAARSYPTPEQWATSAVPYLLQLSAKDNGRSVTAPGSGED